MLFQACKIISLISLQTKWVREVANLTERKNPHTTAYGVKEFVRLSVCYKLWPQLSWEWPNRMGWNFFKDNNNKNPCLQKILSGNNYPDLPHLQGGMKFATLLFDFLKVNNNCFPLTSFVMPCAELGAPELAQNQYSSTDAYTEYKTLAVKDWFQDGCVFWDYLHYKYIDRVPYFH